MTTTPRRPQAPPLVVDRLLVALPAHAAVRQATLLREKGLAWSLCTKEVFAAHLVHANTVTLVRAVQRW